MQDLHIPDFLNIIQTWSSMLSKTFMPMKLILRKQTKRDIGIMKEIAKYFLFNYWIPFLL